MSDLKDGPNHLMLLSTLVARILGIFHFIGELEESILDVFEPFGWRFAILCRPNGWHV